MARAIVAGPKRSSTSQRQRPRPARRRLRKRWPANARRQVSAPPPRWSRCVSTSSGARKADDRTDQGHQRAAAALDPGHAFEALVAAVGMQSLDGGGQPGKGVAEGDAKSALPGFVAADALADAAGGEERRGGGRRRGAGARAA